MAFREYCEESEWILIRQSLSRQVKGPNSLQRRMALILNNSPGFLNEVRASRFCVSFIDVNVIVFQPPEYSVKAFAGKGCGCLRFPAFVVWGGFYGFVAFVELS